MSKPDLRLRGTQAITLGVLERGHVSLEAVASRLLIDPRAAAARLEVLQSRELVQRARGGYTLTHKGKVALAQHRAKVTRRKRTRRAALGISVGGAA